ncbi:rho guanine nucleotide exchange factor 39 isoform X2 [Petromyzon marinus]|uniref:rho guanine nucleotide exchange factor 39 isoform X2 n=1 Tax=Petromyzon marinus TaxID=7757 RepID=UPI003F6FB02A
MKVSSCHVNHGKCFNILHDAGVSHSDHDSTPTVMAVRLRPGQGLVSEQRERWERKRNRTARELVQSEQQYLHHLQLVVTYFVDIMNAKGTLRQEVRNAIFSTVKEIHAVNRTFLSHLEKSNFGLGFESFSLCLFLYTNYIDNLETSCKLLQVQLKKSKEFARFKKLQESRPDFQGLTLEQLLPLPAQRLVQYKHFVRDLAENTNPDSGEFQKLRKAVRAVAEACQHVSDRARRRENALQMVRVQRMLKGRRIDIASPGRRYLREGTLLRVPSKGGDPTPKMFFLFSDLLLMCSRCSQFHPLHADKYECRAVYPLADCSVQKVFGNTQSQGGLINLCYQKEELLLMSVDQDDINDWFKHLDAAIGHLKARSAVIHRQDNLARRPLRSVAAENTQPENSTEPKEPPPSRKRHRADGHEEHHVNGNMDTSAKKTRLVQPPTRAGDGDVRSLPAADSEGICTIL